MRRALLSIAALLIALAAAGVLVTARSDPAGGRVYSVAGILAATGRDAAAWDGRVVRVRGDIQPGLLLVRFHSQLLTVSIADKSDAYMPLSVALAGSSPGYVALADSAHGRAVLWVTPRQPDGLAAALHRLPIVGGLVPGPRQLTPGAATAYLVRLHANHPPCAASACLTGTLLEYALPPGAPAYAPVQPLKQPSP